jgi:hypothetical protein
MRRRASKPAAEHSTALGKWSVRAARTIAVVQFDVVGLTIALATKRRY